MGKKEPLEFDRRYYRTMVKTAVCDNPIRVLVELVLNSADSYERLRLKETTLATNFPIYVTYSKFGRSADIEVKDFAEGMSAKKLREALRYAAPTSGIVEGVSVRGALGFGLKDSLMAMDDATIISIKDGKISETKVVFEEGKPFVDYIRENEEITTQEREKLGINGNGTVVRGILPRQEFEKDFRKIPTFKDVDEYFPSHFMMRKLLQFPEYNILLFKDRMDVPHFPYGKLTYKPLDGKTVYEDEFDVVDPDYDKLKIKLVIKKSMKDITQSGEFREGGLLHSYSKFGIVDCTLWGYDNDPFAQRLFGEVRIDGLEKFLGEEDVIDPKRKGLNAKHQLIEKLRRSLEERLRKLVEKEREEKEVERYSFDKTTIKKVLGELNKIAKKLLGPGLLPPRVDKCPDILFYPDAVTLVEWEEKNVYLFVNQKMLEVGSEIGLSSSTSDIDVRPQKIKLTKSDFQTEEGLDEEFIPKSIKLVGKKASVSGDVRASIGEFSDLIGIDVKENPKLKEEFAFVPQQTKVVDKNEKNAELVMALPLLQNSNPGRISLHSDNPKITCQREYEIPKDLEKFVLGNKVVVLPIPIKGRGIDEEGNITAVYGDKQTNLEVEVIAPFDIGGMFKGFNPTYTGKKVCYYDKKDGIVYYNMKHPLVQRYKKSGKKKRESFLVFLADAISKTICEAIVEAGVERELPQYAILDYSRKEEEVERYTDDKYYEEGCKLHEIMIPLVKTLQER